MKSSLLKRVITASVLIAVVVGFFFLRPVYLPLFNILTGLLIVVGGYELSSKLFLKRVNDNGETEYFATDADKTAMIVTTLSSLLVVPAYAIFGIITAVCVIVSEIVVDILITLIYKKDTKFYLKALLSAVYPKFLLLSLSVANALPQNSLLTLIMIFAIPSATDTFAYFVGSLVKGVKLCPKISPNKTVSGAVGGVIGGMLASIVLFFIFKPDNAWWIFLIIGLVSSVLSQLGDIFESLLKRKIGIKDMGNIFPGHGGVLDRVDGIMVAGTFIAIIMSLI